MANEHANMNVSLPPPMHSWVEAQIAAGRYGNLSEYVRDLIRRDQERQAEERLERLLLEGLESGDPIEVTPEYWGRKRRELLARAEARAKARDQEARG
ncbi:MAG: type II toxin-antitoxin system ParD family antitoxin [Candidatus Eisenbacteria bacterium]|nr:type II toxin-antitoxin system ParD family antitoxin [Candidatus Eisenbacteria bacterium]